jgi:hypothetical protein
MEEGCSTGGSRPARWGFREPIPIWEGGERGDVTGGSLENYKIVTENTTHLACFSPRTQFTATHIIQDLTSSLSKVRDKCFF